MVRRSLFALLAVILLAADSFRRSPASPRRTPPPRASRSRSASFMSGRSGIWAGPTPTTRADWRWKRRSRTSKPAYQENVPENAADAERVIRQFAQDGYDVIFTTSFGYMDPTINVAKDFPDTTFIHISGFKTADNVGTGFGKIEEPRFVSGQIAGAMTEIEPDRLRRRLPDPGSHPRYQRLHPRRARGQPGRDRARGLDQHLVQPADGARRPPKRCSTAAPT